MLGKAAPAAVIVGFLARRGETKQTITKVRQTVTKPFLDNTPATRWLPSSDYFPAAAPGNAFYHESLDCCYIMDENNEWLLLATRRETRVARYRHRSKCERIEWVVRGERIWITKSPQEYNRHLKIHLSGLKWKCFDPAKPLKPFGWTCDYTHTNSMYLKNYLGA
jgi:hypothetical protein